MKPAAKTAAALTGLLALSLALRLGQLRAGFWIDEGISVGVAHHHWSSIPHVLRQDGSPPAYYMLLGLWIRLFGDSEAATHSLSLLFSLACVPLAYEAGRRVFDRRTGLVCALLVATTPYLVYYATETRMYAYEAFLSLIAAVAYVEGVMRGRRAWAIALVPTVALQVYGHNWALFFCVALALATVLYAPERLGRFALVAGGVALLYVPWLPTLWSQVQHTGAPWSTKPSFHELFSAVGAVLGGDAAFV
ncbi:MAG: glycosyltransferase family 39 protein, partial [Gaiellaceae bacterium]